MLAGVLRPALFASTTRDWQGVENLPTDRGFIAAANHVTNFDPLTMAHYLWDNGHAPRILAKDSLFAKPVLGSILHSIGAIPVVRGSSAAVRALDAAAEALEAGECILLFPEGTLTRDPDLWPMQAKTGAARLAFLSGAPIIPIAQWGAHHVLPRYGQVMHPFPRKPVTVVAGPPVDLSDLRSHGEESATVKVATDRVMERITSQLAQIRQQTPPAQMWDPRTRTSS